jgi:hypothetical protein
MEISPSGGIDSFRNLLDALNNYGLLSRTSEPGGSVPGLPGYQTIDLRYSIRLKGIKYLKKN